MESIADRAERRKKGVREVGEGEAGQCGHPGCTSTRGLMKPKRLTYLRAKAYKGAVYCMQHNPRFGTDLDFVGKLSTDRFGGDAA